MKGVRFFRFPFLIRTNRQTPLGSDVRLEPPLNEVLADPIVKALAASDGMSVNQLESFASEMQGRLPP